MMIVRKTNGVVFLIAFVTIMCGTPVWASGGVLTQKEPAFLGRELTLFFEPTVYNASAIVEWKRRKSSAWHYILESESVIMTNHVDERTYSMTVIKPSTYYNAVYSVKYNSRKQSTSRALRVTLKVLTGCGMLVRSGGTPIIEGADFKLKFIPNPNISKDALNTRRLEKDYAPLDVNQKSRLKEVFNSSTNEYTLTVTRATRVDSGDYRIRCGSDMESMNYVDINIFYPPLSVTVHGPEIPGNIAEHYTLSVTCFVNGSNPACTPVWSRPCSSSSSRCNPLRKGKSGRSFYTSQTTSFTVLDKDNFENIRCTATCDNFPNLRMIAYTTIVLHYKPKVTVSPSTNLQLLVGGAVTIRCAWQSAPEAEVAWVRAKTRQNPENLMTNSTYLCDSDLCLTLTDLREDDSGNYTCRANNKVYPVTISTIEILVNDNSDFQTHRSSNSDIIPAITVSGVVLLVIIVGSIIFIKRRCRPGTVQLDTAIPSPQRYYMELLPGTSHNEIGSLPGDYTEVADHVYMSIEDEPTKETDASEYLELMDPDYIHPVEVEVEVEERPRLDEDGYEEPSNVRLAAGGTGAATDGDMNRYQPPVSRTT